MKNIFFKSGLICFLALSVSNVAWTAEVPSFDRQVLIKSREQSVQRFVTELFGRVGVPVDFAPEITGMVNGDFAGSAKSVFDQVARTFQVAYYYDGSKVYVYPSNQSERNILRLSPAVAKRVVANARQMGLPDVSNTLAQTDMGLVVTGSQRFRDQVQQILKAVDKPTVVKKAPIEATHDAFKMFKLRYAWAHDVVMEVGGQKITVPGVATTLRTLIEPGAIASRSNQGTGTSNTLEGLRGQGLQGQVSLANQGNSEEPSSTLFSGSGSAGSSRIVADSLNNAVLIRDKPERLAAYEQLINTLDVEPKMIEIEATIIDMDTDKLRDLGVNWRAQLDNAEVLVGSGGAGDLQLQPNIGGIAPSGQGGILSLVLGDRYKFISRIRALETQGAARIVSKPHVMTLSNVEALLDTTSTFFVRVEGQEEVDLFNVSVGTKLRVTPHVFNSHGQDQIKLLVSIEDGSASDRQVDNIPVIESSSINTQALINVGESLLIGGLVRELKTDRLSKVPLLGDIPGLGALFRNNVRTSSRVERLFLITPRLSLRPGTESVARLSAPYLSGTEGEIVSSAPRRMESVQQALAARDDRFSIEESLPKSGGNTVNLTPEGVSANVERLQRPSVQQEQPTVNTRPSQGDGWQTVGGSVTDVIASPSSVAARVQGANPVQADATQSDSEQFNEWQAISK